MSTEDFLRSLDRRTFLRIVSVTGLTGLIYPPKLLATLAPADLSRVVIVEDSGATSGTSIVEAVAYNMMDCAVMNLTEIYDTGEAWKSLFPGIDTSSVVAIKVNCINSSMPTHPEVTNAVVNGLTQMAFGGTPFPDNNIIIFDRTNGELSSSGYDLNTSDTGVRCFGTNQSGVGYSTATYSVNGSTQRLSTILTEMADYLVNISVLKNHNMAGVTICMKNHYGTCNSPGSLHGGYCDPYIPALNALTEIKAKQRVNILDALLGVYAGGPGGSPQFAPNQIVMSQDIVAVDYWGRELLDDAGCTTIGIATHVDTAAGAPYNLGTNDPGSMDIVTVTDPSGIDDIAAPSGFVLQQNRPNPFTSRTDIRFHIARPQALKLTVYDSGGRQVRRLLDSTPGTGWQQVTWDGRNDAGRRVAGGVYYAQLRTSTSSKAVIMQLVR